MGSRVKGSIVQSRLDFVRERLGPTGPEKLLGALPAEDRERIERDASAGAWYLGYAVNKDGERIRRIESDVPVGDWYPFGLLVRIDRAIAELCGGEQALEDVGARSADFHIGTLYRKLARMSAPQDFFRNTSLVHQLYHDSGSMQYEAAGDRGCRLRVFGPDVDPIYCRSAIGYFRRAATLCGGEGARVEEVRCRNRGDDSCEYRVSW